jgi:Carboxypeptidase regulatory-like domain
MQFIRQRAAVTALAALFLFASLAAAQSITTGEITGTVTDPSGAVIAGATVTLTSPGTGSVRTDSTDVSGVYRFPLLQPGDYILKIVSAGFQTSEIKTTITLGATNRMDAKLNVSTSNATIEINAEATAIQTENADIQTTFDSKQLEMLPNPGNDLTYYAQLSPGAVMNTGGGYGNLSVFGLPGTSNLFTLNGQNDNDPFLNLNNSGATNLLLGSNEMAEVSVTTNGYSGQYGQLAGAQVNYVTKSGTNSFHGNANYYWNGRVMNANDWFNNATGEPRAFDNVNQYSGSVGGPIWKNHTFFFSDYEGLRALIPLAGTDVRLPSAAFQSAVLGNLQTDGNSAEIPFYQQAFKAWNGAIGASRATPVPSSSSDVQGPGCGDLTILAAGTACATQYFITPVNFAPEWLWTLRVDQNFGDKDRIYGRFQIDHGTQPTGTSPLSPLFSLKSYQPENQQQISWTHVFGPNATNSFTGSHLYYAAAFSYADVSATNALFAPQLGLADGSFATLNGPETAFPQGRDVQQGQIGDDFSFTKGRQTIKIGGNWHKDWVYDFDFMANTQGAVTFGSIDDFYAGTIGAAGSFTQAFPSKQAENIGVYQLGIYAEDDIKVSKNLTVNFSLRADHNSNPTCQGDCFETSASSFSTLDHDINTPYNSAIQTGRSQAYYSTNAIVWGPRMGVAWSLTPKTVLRAGAGIFADAFPAFVVDGFVENLPNYNAVNLPGSLYGTSPAAPGVAGSVFSAASSTNASLISGFNSGGTLASLTAANPTFAPPNLVTMDPTIQQPRYYEWNIELQQDVGWHTVFSANYVGNHGVKEPIENQGLNAFCPAGCGSGLPIASAPPDARFGFVSEYQSSGESRYNGLVISLKHSLTNHLAFGLNYTYSHAMDDVSNGGLLPFSFSGQGSILSPEDPYAIRAYNYGNADYDVRQYFSANYVIDDLLRALHFTKGSNAVFGGWTLSGTLLDHTGFPFSVVENNALLPNYGGTVFAQPITAGWSSCGGGAAYTNNTPCLNPNNFAPSMSTSGVLDSFSTQNRNQYRGPGYFNTDLSISKQFDIGEHLHFGVGAQFFNLFNHPNFAQPQSNIDSPGIFGQTFGLVSEPTSILGAFLGGDASPRLIQLHGTLRF